MDVIKVFCDENYSINDLANIKKKNKLAKI